MQNTAKGQLARALIDAHRIRESSWDGKGYMLSTSAAAHQATTDKDLQHLVGIINAAGHEGWQWAHEFLSKHE